MFSYSFSAFSINYSKLMFIPKNESSTSIYTSYSSSSSSSDSSDSIGEGVFYFFAFLLTCCFFLLEPSFFCLGGLYFRTGYSLLCLFDFFFSSFFFNDSFNSISSILFIYCSLSSLAFSFIAFFSFLLYSKSLIISS
jgi:hypothetical protein